MKSLAKLKDIYFASVGDNAVLLLNVPPDRRGLIHENDVARLAEFGEWVRSTFKENLAAGATADASHTRTPAAEFSAARTVDADRDTFWSTDDWQQSAEITCQLRDAQTFNIALLEEQIREGQRIESFAVDAFVDGGWREVGRATTVGCRRLLRFAPVQTDRVRVRIIDSRVRPTLANFGLFRDNTEK